MDHQDLHFPETENIGNLERIIRTAIGVLMIEAPKRDNREFDCTRSNTLLSGYFINRKANPRHS